MKTMKPVVILFDVNETLLDMTPLKQKINKLLGSKKGFRIWFGLLLQYSLVDNSTGIYHDFSTIADATLDMAAIALGEVLTEDGKKEALSIMKKLSAYKDVKKGLSLLKDSGFRLATLTYSSTESMIAQLAYSGLEHYFDKKLSIESIQRYKPGIETYKWAAVELSVDVKNIIMVAAHGWDIAGAIQAGMQTAFIERKGQSLYRLAPVPEFSGKNLIEVAKSIISKYRSHEA